MMKTKAVLIQVLFGIAATCISQVVMAGVFEFSSSFSYNRSNFNDGSFQWTKRYGASLGYYFTQDTELSFSYQDSTTKTVVPGVQDVTFRDRVYSLDLNYHFFDQNTPFRPYVKMGVGQLNRDAEGTYAGGFSPPGRTDQVTAVLGLGARARITQQLGFRAELNSYLVGGAISSWKDNLALMIGGSYFF